MPVLLERKIHLPYLFRRQAYFSVIKEPFKPQSTATGVISTLPRGEELEQEKRMWEGLNY